MSLMNILQISSQGMTAQRERLEAASANLANANTTRTVEGGPYRRRDVVFEAVSVNANNGNNGNGNGNGNEQFSSLFDEAAPELSGVRARTFIAPDNGGNRQYQPNHPDADADGYLLMPEIDALEESVNIISATRSFEANVTAFNTAKELARTSLKLSEI